jgi:hypothetical protein
MSLHVAILSDPKLRVASGSPSDELADACGGKETDTTWRRKQHHKKGKEQTARKKGAVLGIDRKEMSRENGNM